MSLKSLCGCVLLVAAGACASSQVPQSGAADDVQQSASRSRTSRNRDLITQEDLAAEPTLKASAVLDVIRALKPQFLSDRGTNTMNPYANDPEAGQVHASVNGGRIVALTDLNEIHGNEVLEIRYLNAGQAMQKFGTAARQGPVILVTTITK